MSKLVIVESPAKAKTINKFLGKEYSVKACMGHVRDLPDQELGIDLENGFRPKYVTIKGKAKLVAEIKKAAEASEGVLLATDPDREGEAIAWHIAQCIGSRGSHDGDGTGRILFNEITEAAIKTAVLHPLGIDINKVDAQQARRVLDRLVGYQVSPLLWKTIHGGLSAGRVQSVALRLVCQREREIVAFIAEEYWSVDARLQDASDQAFTARLLTWMGKSITIENEERASAIVEELRALPFLVLSVDRGEQKRNPPPPFTTSTLQQDAARRLGFTVKKTMAVAQQLYEGIDVGGDTVGLITYMRTDSVRCSPEAVSSAREYVARVFGKQFLPKAQRAYRNKGTAQDAHEAVRPTYLSRPPTEIRSFLTEDQRKLYDLVWRRFVASQMSSAVYSTVSVDIGAGDYVFRASESIVKFQGYQALYTEAKDDEPVPEERKIPDALTVGQPLSLLDLLPEQHFTKPPARYTEASLVKELDAKGIGRPSTYSQIIGTLLDREYVAKEKGKFKPTDLGMTVSDLLVASFPDIFSVEFTARMESDLDRVEAGQDQWIDVVQHFYEPFSRALREVSLQSRTLKQALQEATDQVCEQCGSPMVVKWGRNGKFIACSGYPNCRNTMPLESLPAPPLPDQACDKCGSPMLVKSGRYGPFLACSNYPKCRNTQPISVGVGCAVEGCTGKIVEKRSKRGRVFFGCSRYPSCKYATWDRPVDHSCPICKAPFLLGKRDHLECPRCHHELAE